MSDVEFKPDQEFISTSGLGAKEHMGVVTKFFMKLSFGAIKTSDQANAVMIVITVISIGLSLYFFFS